MCQRLIFFRAAMAGCPANRSAPAVPKSNLRLCIFVSSVPPLPVHTVGLLRPLPNDLCRCRRTGEADEKEVRAVVPPAGAVGRLDLCQVAEPFDFDPFRRL